MLIDASERIDAKGEGVRLNCCSIPPVSWDGRMMTPDGRASGSCLLIQLTPTDPNLW